MRKRQKKKNEKDRLEKREELLPIIEKVVDEIVESSRRLGPRCLERPAAGELKINGRVVGVDEVAEQIRSADRAGAEKIIISLSSPGGSMQEATAASLIAMAGS